MHTNVDYERIRTTYTMTFSESGRPRRVYGNRPGRTTLRREALKAQGVR